MDSKKVYKEIKNLLSELTEEHKILLKEGEEIKNLLENDLNDNIVLRLEDFLKKVNRHAQIEENDLDKALQEAGITDFDIEALNFGHRTLDEIAEHLEYLVALYKKGERQYRGKDLQNEIIKTFHEYAQTLKDHFTEEEHFFFPDILKHDLERFE